MRLLLTVLSISFLCFTSYSKAQTASHKSCEMAENTADVMNCVKQRHDDSQERLKTLYDKLLAAEDSGGAPSAFRDTQQRWIEYRDQQCEWEIAQEATESLKRLRQLSCVGDLTAQRADILSLVLSRLKTDNDEAVHYGSAVRWMNSLATDHPEIFWRYGDNIRGDLDCDGEDEVVISGLTTNLRKVRTENSDAYIVKSYVAVSTNPATGRPQSTIFELPVSDEHEAVCDSTVSLEIIADDDQEGCSAAVEINRGQCAPRLIGKKDDGFVLLPEISGEE